MRAPVYDVVEEDVWKWASVWGVFYSKTLMMKKAHWYQIPYHLFFYFFYLALCQKTFWIAINRTSMHKLIAINRD